MYTCLHIYSEIGSGHKFLQLRKNPSQSLSFTEVMYGMLLAYSMMCLVFGSVSTNGVPVVNTKLGDIRGKSITTDFKGIAYTINRYAGLRYAKAPVGELRFQKPVPFGNFESPLDASDFTSACPQNDMLKFGVDSMDEDCLSLNVYVPTENPDRPEGFAVMIFIHGGGFTIGASSMYPGEVLAGVGNVIVVTINYRLGLFGFANSGDGQIAGNFGFWDQQMAFRWVKENIESFRGDNSRITIFGQSAGGISVLMQSLYPSNTGLFQNVIAQSGAPTLPLPQLTNNFDNMDFLAGSLGCKTDTREDVIDCLKNAKTEDLMAKSAELSSSLETATKVQFFPTIDGDFFKRPLVDLVDESKHGNTNEQLNFFRSLNLITGATTADGALYVMLLGQDYENATVSREEFVTTHVPNMVNFFLNHDRKEVPKAFLDVIAYEYTDFENLNNFRDAFISLSTDFVFTSPVREWLDIHTNSTTSNTYFYNFDADLEISPVPTPAWVKGANHADELPAVFGYCMSSLIGTMAMQNLTDYMPPAWELDLSERVMAYWANFAKTGDPNNKNPGNLVTWPQSEAGDTAYIVFSNKDSVRHDNLYGRAMTFWREIVPALWNAIGDVKSHADETSFAKMTSETCDAGGNCD